MGTYNTPGVYIREIPTLPASVAQVATAIPAFIGYTEKASNNGVALTKIPTRISSLIEYEKFFGGPQPETGIDVNVNWNAEGNIAGVSLDPVSTFSKFVMYYQMQMYFANGGGPCYIVSVGDYSGSVAVGDNNSGLTAGLNAVALEDEPTLIVFPDAKGMNPGVNEAGFYGLYIQALNQCNTLQDRFTIVDVYSDPANLRTQLASDYLKYGAAYYPDLQSSLSYTYIDEDITVAPIFGEYIVTGSINVRYHGPDTDNPAITVVEDSTPANAPTFVVGQNNLTIHINSQVSTAITDLLTAWAAHTDKGRFTITGDDPKNPLDPNTLNIASVPMNYTDTHLAVVATVNTQVYNQIKAEIAKHSPVLSPSAAIAGVYARTDRDRGVWKAPANTPLANVIAPTVKITDAMQDNLNVDAGSGKSINAIRAFYGKGTLVWGARTLAGNDNEWRYVSTRRLFIMAEESIQKSTGWVVFQPNDARTWIKVKAQIENFLSGLWRDGALAGAKAEEAFFVNIGLGITMDNQDILEGRMNIEIGMAAVRPAEFIILKFSHKLQKS